MITTNSLADTSVNGDGGMNLTIDNGESEIQGFASLGVFTGGNLTASTINLLLENYDSGLIDGEASIFCNIGGTLTIGRDANLVLNNGDAGGTIDSFASLTLTAAAISTGGTLNVVIANNDEGNISGDAALLVNSTGDLTIGADAGFTIDNSAFSSAEFVNGGEIASNATIALLAQNISTGGGLFTFLFNDGGGHIGGDASILAGISGDLTTQDALFFDVQNSADTNGEEILPGGAIDGNATVALAVAGSIVSGNIGELAVLNNDLRFLGQGGTISGDAIVGVTADSVSTAGFFQPLVNNTNGVIGGGASVTVGAAGDITVGRETFFNILNTGGVIGNDALSTLSAANYSTGSTFELQILNDNGSVGGSAILNANFSGSLTSAGDAFVQIINSGGTISGNAAIDLSAANLTANSFLTTQIDNTEGTIGGSATINSTFTGTATVSADANLNIFGSDAATGGAAINFNGGTYNVGGTFRSTIDGDGAITFNNASINADVFKTRVFGANGTLTVGGGALSGNTELKLYAPGSNGRVDFISNVTLNSESNVILAAQTVTINNGVVVTITGDDGTEAFVFTKVPNYTGSGGNNSTTGMFAGNGAQTFPLTQAPPFDNPGAADAPAKATSVGTSAPTPTSKPGLPGNRGGGADTINPRSRPRVTIARVTDSNELLDLADKVTSGPIETDHSKSKAPAGKTSRSPGSALSRKGRPLSPASLTPADLALARSGVRRPTALP